MTGSNAMVSFQYVEWWGINPVSQFNAQIMKFVTVFNGHFCLKITMRWN